MKEKDGSRGSGSGRTRSQKAAEWTAADCVVLVNVIAAVEADCLKALSSYQKWKIVAENCTSLDVVRNSDQCRRKWDHMLMKHDAIKQWELGMQDAESYWCMESGRRKELGLPDNFDEELFKAIDNVASMRANQSDTEPDSDPEAVAEIVDEVAEPGSKRKRRGSMSKRNQALEKSVKCEEEEEEGKPPLASLELKPRECYTKIHGEKATDNTELEEQMMAKKLLEAAEKVQAIVSENAEYATSDEKNVDHRIDLVRRQGSKLIRCLGDFLSTINDLRGMLEDCE